MSNKTSTASIRRQPIEYDTQGIDRKYLAEIRRRFIAINKLRMQRIRDDSSKYLRRIIDAIPLLLHVNHPLLPGYVNAATPCAISDYSPLKAQLGAVKRIARSFDYEKKAPRTRDILSLFLMGSMGTLGQSRSSDLDIWVVYRPTLTREQVQQLALKLKRIEKWSIQYQVDINFYPMHPDHFRDQNVAEMDQEHCGSTQHFLLLDEFYRTALFIAGRFPLWWLVPPQQESNYAAFASHLVEKRFLRSGDWVDFGGVGELPADEYFGAALWHLNKSIDSPYKSNLKMLLMEAYAASHPNVEPLSTSLKARVFAGRLDQADVDPYLLIYRRVEHYLQANGDLQRLEWVRRCIYLKTGERISVKLRGRKSWQRELTEQLVNQWGWEKDRLLLLDARRQWKVFRTLKERNVLIQELTQCYRFLSRFAREHGVFASISEEDMSVLGRKLYATFERRADKLERVNPGIAPDLSESELSCSLRQQGKQQQWCLYRGTITPGEIDYHQPLFQQRHLLAMLGWAYLNGLLRRTTRVSLLDDDLVLTSAELRGIIRVLFEYFPQTDHIASIENYRCAALPRFSLYLINIGFEPMQRRRQQGLELVSNRSNPLSYGHARELLLGALDTLSLNSWHEVSHRRFRGPTSLLHTLIHACNQRRLTADWTYKVVCECGHHRRQLQQRVFGLIEQLLAFDREYHLGRFVLELCGELHVLGLRQSGVEMTSASNLDGLMEILAYPSEDSAFVATCIDCESLVEQPLAWISEQARRGELSIYFQLDGRMATVWLCDEQGALARCHQRYDDPASLERTCRVFLESVAHRQLAQAGGHSAERARFFKLTRHHDEWQRSPLSGAHSTPLRYYPVQGIIEPGSNGREQLTVYCDNLHFSEAELGDQFYPQIAAHIHKQRSSGGRYPVYLTDLDLGDGGGLALSSSCYLKRKWQIEAALTDVLEKR